MTKGNGFRSILLVFFFLWMGELLAQGGKYWVFLSDKKESSFDPYTYFHPAAIERRLAHGVALDDSTDFPLNPNYLNQIELTGVEIRNESRWLNAVSCIGTEEQLERIQSFPFVKSIELITSQANVAAFNQAEILAEQAGIAQTAVLGEREFEAANIRGKGIRIAIFDVGFKGYLELPEFAHLREANAIEQVYDFIGKDKNVSRGGTHGTSVFSCIGGIDQGEKLGLATEATYLLARTERNNVELSSEEDAWVAAAEWADKNGVHIINSSLGYTNHRYFKSMMDGKTAPVSRAATWAARKGILVVNAAGNDGERKWNFIGAPADADSVLSVGALNPYSYLPASFSSLGPTSDGRMKPNVVAFGYATCATPKGLQVLPGTSFATPLVAGFAACAWQGNRTLSKMELFELIEQSGQLYPYFDYTVGYGVPQASFVIQRESLHFNFEVTSAANQLEILAENTNDMVLFKEAKGVEAYIYYKYLNSRNDIVNYGCIIPNDAAIGDLSLSQRSDVKRIEIHFLGTTKTIEL